MLKRTYQYKVALIINDCHQTLVCYEKYESIHSFIIMRSLLTKNIITRNTIVLNLKPKYVYNGF